MRVSRGQRSSRLQTFAISQPGEDFSEFIRQARIGSVVGGRVLRHLGGKKYTVALQGHAVVAEAAADLEVGSALRGVIRQVQPQVIVQLTHNDQDFFSCLAETAPEEIVQHVRLRPWLGELLIKIRRILGRESTAAGNLRQGLFKLTECLSVCASEAVMSGQLRQLLADEQRYTARRQTAELMAGLPAAWGESAGDKEGFSAGQVHALSGALQEIHLHLETQQALVSRMRRYFPFAYAQAAVFCAERVFCLEIKSAAFSRMRRRLVAEMMVPGGETVKISLIGARTAAPAHIIADSACIADPVFQQWLSPVSSDSDHPDYVLEPAEAAVPEIDQWFLINSGTFSRIDRVV
ncbi:MAG: hypothetical protein NC924_02375 [Candidatus Omnitrophica bacterium]|nr:hypothetical protein [Candidatus Omnitrophota bacterium]